MKKLKLTDLEIQSFVTTASKVIGGIGSGPGPCDPDPNSNACAEASTPGYCQASYTGPCQCGAGPPHGSEIHCQGSCILNQCTVLGCQHAL